MESGLNHFFQDIPEVPEAEKISYEEFLVLCKMKFEPKKSIIEEHYGDIE